MFRLGFKSVRAHFFPFLDLLSLNVKDFHQRWRGVITACPYGSCLNGCEPCSKHVPVSTGFCHPVGSRHYSKCVAECHLGNNPH
jgi:hypothetical protein